ncbi:hypothetical protein A3K69_04115 [Candidatus Bathyarchaeota archaeon RBG_16_57_9]|jgi:predicted nucleic acid-binding protein|nr:MAG: hypothetical protein A3K69_04115 [Candidatus Bathyarchaeota archaeon RBG_16_57_9]OGD52350.1 MAG: hypothetical protein A3K81_04110 [Candidatus Bathyarchaeota archaeon RBG_13_60_20]
MTAMVLDASSLLLLIKSRGPEAANALKDAATVPLAGYEVGNALRTSVQVHHEMAPDTAETTLGNIHTCLKYMKIVDQSSLQAMTETLRTSLKHGLTYYDAAYLAVALSLGAPLITDDRHLAEAARRAGIQTADMASLTA